MRSLAALIARVREAPPLPPYAEPNGEEGTVARTRKEEGGGDGREQQRDHAAFLARAAEDAAAALAASDPDPDRERAEVAAAQAAEARGEYGRPKPETDHRAMLAGFLAAGLQRPPAWADLASVPPKGAWCSCCGRFSRRGGRWWREAVNPSGWRCMTCRPPVHLPPGAVVERRT